MEDIANWDVLLVLKMDRIHRNSRNFMEMMDNLRRHDKEFVSMTESLDTSTAMGRFVVDIIQRIAQLESEQIGERVYAGMHQKANTPLDRLDPERSPYLGFNHPYGYDYQNSELIINQEQAAGVKKIFSSYMGGKTMGEIAKYLNRTNVPTKRGGKWAKRTISKILKNPVYCGYTRWVGITKASSHTPIVDEETFDKVQKIISDRISKLSFTVTKGVSPVLSELR